tara:strand:- start:168 stop:587 length:420 start_codon:yes stop_codon:yes gene_type:complete
MSSLIDSTWQLVSGIIENVVSVGTMLFTWLFDVLLILHNDMPRVEGLLVGVIFAWFFVHRDKNPFVRALAAPLKIILDILDIIWDETLEAIADLYSVAKEKTISIVVGLKNKATGLVTGITDRLSKIKDALLSKFKKEE